MHHRQWLIQALTKLVMIMFQVEEESSDDELTLSSSRIDTGKWRIACDKVQIRSSVPVLYYYKRGGRGALPINYL